MSKKLKLLALRKGTHMLRTWILTVSVSSTLFFIYGIPYSYGVFFEHVADELALNRAMTSLIFSINSFIFFLSGALSGSLADRYGHSTIMRIGNTLLVASLSLLSLGHSFYYVILFYGIMAGLGLGMINSSSYPSLARLFTNRRGLAQGIGAAGAGFGVLIIPSVADNLVKVWGWRASYLFLGLLASMPLYLNAYLLQQRARKQKEDSNDKDDMLRNSQSLSLIRAMKKGSFWILFLFYLGVGAVVGTVFVHLIPFSMDMGLEREIAVTSLSFAGGASIFGRLALGLLSDYLGRRVSLMICSLLLGGGLLLLLNAEKAWMLTYFALAFGVGWGGSVALVPPALADLFGPSYVNSLYGILSLAWGIGSSVAPYTGGLVFDALKSYHMILLSIIVMMLVITMLLIFIGKEY
ncbi:MAG: MFS transporter [Candidatus Caldarchaeum sp.]